MSEDEALSFNLVDRPWLLACRRDGTLAELSLRDVFVQAPQLNSLLGDVPTQVFAVTRLLLAILHRAVAGPRDLDHWTRLWQDERLPVEQIEQYLERWRHRFDLLHFQAPFFQVADLRTEKGEASELNKLVADIPNGYPFFCMRLDRELSLPFAEAARWVVHCQAFDPSGIKSGAVGDSRVKGGKGYPIGTGWGGYLGGLIPEGPTLRDTLLLNLIARDHPSLPGRQEEDLPAWERDPVGPAEEVAGGRAPTGPIDLYTWQSRRIRLTYDHDRVTGVLVCNGERITPQNKHTVEAHSAWRRSQAQEKKLRTSPVYMPREHDPERAIWRGLQSLLPAAAGAGGGEPAPALTPAVLEWLSHLSMDVLGLDYPVHLHAIGMTYGSQSSTTEEVIDDALAVRSVLLTRRAEHLVSAVVASVSAAESAARALSSLAGRLTEAAGGDPDGPRDRAREHAYAELDVLFRDWLARLRPDTDSLDAQQDWHRTAYYAIRTLGSELLRRSPEQAWVGRLVKERRLTSAHADRWFRKDLRDALPLAFAETDTPAVTPA